ncbi:hypothetical protein EVG20_g2756 [Dentipellis fragilis]|uniref:Uncharacterized protein n=1 Tax=Dentipellis fragilis TaxID=205917 RepID=A0A4Y9Z6T8_9AGAM|nr:hypothetical protein EVG20_g2756 [Dentipellis fragilis]
MASFLPYVFAGVVTLAAGSAGYVLGEHRALARYTPREIPPIRRPPSAVNTRRRRVAARRRTPSPRSSWPTWYTQCLRYHGALHAQAKDIPDQPSFCRSPFRYPLRIAYVVFDAYQGPYMSDRQRLQVEEYQRKRSRASDDSESNDEAPRAPHRKDEDIYEDYSMDISQDTDFLPPETSPAPFPSQPTPPMFSAISPPPAYYADAESDSESRTPSPRPLVPTYRKEQLTPAQQQYVHALLQGDPELPHPHDLTMALPPALLPGCYNEPYIASFNAPAHHTPAPSHVHDTEQYWDSDTNSELSTTTSLHGSPGSVSAEAGSFSQSGSDVDYASEEGSQDESQHSPSVSAAPPAPQPTLPVRYDTVLPPLLPCTLP